MSKIFFVANSAYTILNFRGALLKSLIDDGHHVTIICPSTCDLLHSNYVVDEIEKTGANYLEIPLSRSGTNPLEELRTLRRLVYQMKTYKPDFVLNYTVKANIYSSIASKIAGINSISSNITGIGSSLTGRMNGLRGWIISLVVKLMYKISLAQNNVVFFQNRDDFELFQELSLVQIDKCQIINGSGVNLEYFKRTAPISKEVSFLFVGRLLKSKGIHEFLDAARSIKAKYPATAFSVAGSYDENPESLNIEEIEELEKHGNIQFLGHVSDIRKQFEQHNIIVLPSYREGTPKAVLEAMSFSMPVITTDAPGCRETVIEGVNGHLVPVRDTENLKFAMEKFVLDPNKIQQFGQQSRKLVEQKYDESKIVLDVRKAIGLPSSTK